MAEEQFNAPEPGPEPVDAAADPLAATASASQYGVGPFSIRETSLIGLWVVMFLVSFFSLSVAGFASVWSSGLWWILTVGAPTLAVFLVVLRRLSPEGIRRFGSLGIDQFASVAFAVSAIVWAQQAWDAVSVAIRVGYSPASWVIWVELLLALGGVVLTVLAPHLPVLGDDFDGRAPAPAHRVARAPRPVSPRPPGLRGTPAAVAPTAAWAAEADTAVLSDLRAGSEELQVVEDVIVEPSSIPVAEQTSGQEAFWALAPDERTVHDEYGAPLFVVGPTAWALVIEDRGELFVIRHEDGRIGYLHDVTGILRG